MDDLGFALIGQAVETGSERREISGSALFRPGLGEQQFGKAGNVATSTASGRRCVVMVPIQAAHSTKINQQLEAVRKGSSPRIFVDHSMTCRVLGAATTVG